MVFLHGLQSTFGQVFLFPVEMCIKGKPGVKYTKVEIVKMRKKIPDPVTVLISEQFAKS